MYRCMIILVHKRMRRLSFGGGGGGGGGLKSFAGIMSSAESQKGAIADQRCSVENQKDAIAIDFVQQ